MSPQTSRPLFPRILRNASPALWPARIRLTALKDAYRAGSFSGHPEMMLDAIDAVEHRIRDYVNGKQSVKVTSVTANEATVAEPARSAQEQREYEELTARCDKRGGPFEPGLEAAQRRLSYMQYLSRHGGFMGHPEDLAEDIELEERYIKRLTAESTHTV